MRVILGKNPVPDGQRQLMLLAIAASLPLIRLALHTLTR